MTLPREANRRRRLSGLGFTLGGNCSRGGTRLKGLEAVMGLLERFEDSLDRLVNGAFARAFKAEVQPVEIAAALQREVDDRA